MVTTLNLISQPAAFDNRYFKVNPTKLNYVIDLQIVILIPRFEPLKNIIAGLLISNYMPHCLGKVNIIFKFDFLVQFLLWKVIKIILLSQLFLFCKSLLLFRSDLFIIFRVYVDGGLAQIVINCNLVIQEVLSRVDECRLVVHSCLANERWLGWNTVIALLPTSSHVVLCDLLTSLEDGSVTDATLLKKSVSFLILAMD